MDASACAGVAYGFARYIELASVPLASYLVGSGPSELFGFMFHVSDRERATRSQGPHGGAVHHAAAQRCIIFQTCGVSASTNLTTLAQARGVQVVRWNGNGLPPGEIDMAKDMLLWPRSASFPGVDGKTLVLL